MKYTWSRVILKNSTSVPLLFRSHGLCRGVKARSSSEWVSGARRDASRGTGTLGFLLYLSGLMTASTCCFMVTAGAVQLPFGPKHTISFSPSPSLFALFLLVLFFLLLSFALVSLPRFHLSRSPTCSKCLHHPLLHQPPLFNTLLSLPPFFLCASLP